MLSVDKANHKFIVQYFLLWLPNNQIWLNFNKNVEVCVHVCVWMCMCEHVGVCMTHVCISVYVHSSMVLVYMCVHLCICGACVCECACVYICVCTCECICICVDAHLCMPLYVCLHLCASVHFVCVQASPWDTLLSHQFSVLMCVHIFFHSLLVFLNASGCDKSINKYFTLKSVFLSPSLISIQSTTNIITKRSVTSISQFDIWGNGDSGRGPTCCDQMVQLAAYLDETSARLITRVPLSHLSEQHCAASPLKEKLDRH